MAVDMIRLDIESGGIGLDIPVTDGAIRGGGEEVSLVEWIPGDSITIGSVAVTNVLRPTDVVSRLGGVFGVVEDEDIGVGRFGGHNELQRWEREDQNKVRKEENKLFLPDSEACISLDEHHHRD
jgi:hypothetical protein